MDLQQYLNLWKLKSIMPAISLHCLTTIINFRSGFFSKLSALTQCNKNNIRLSFSIIFQYPACKSFILLDKKNISLIKIIEGEVIIFWREIEQSLALRKSIRFVWLILAPDKQLHIIWSCIMASPILLIILHHYVMYVSNSTCISFWAVDLPLNIFPAPNSIFFNSALQLIELAILSFLKYSN